MDSYITYLRSMIGHQPVNMPGASVLLFDDQHRLLLQRRTDTCTWGLPGGIMELGESFEETAKREVEEETGLSIQQLSLFGVFSGPALFFRYPNGDEIYNVVAVFLAEGISGELKADEQESLELRYFSLDDLPPDIVSPDIPILSEVQKRFLKEG